MVGLLDDQYQIHNRILHFDTFVYDANLLHRLLVQHLSIYLVILPTIFIIHLLDMLQSKFHSLSLLLDHLCFPGHLMLQLQVNYFYQHLQFDYYNKILILRWNCRYTNFIFELLNVKKNTAISSSVAFRSSDLVNIRIHPSFPPVIISPLGKLATHQTDMHGIKIVCKHFSVFQILTDRSSPL